MTPQHLYLRVQRLPSLGNDANWDALIDALMAKGPKPVDVSIYTHPEYLLTPRPDLSGASDYTLATEILFEAEFDSVNISAAWFIAWLESEFGVSGVTTTTSYDQYGRNETLSYSGNDYFVVSVFGFVSGQGWPSYEDSHAAVTQYLIDNMADWEQA